MNKVDYCLYLTEKAIMKFEKMINYPFYMDKIDSIFVPNLNFTAMEFLGCVVYKQEIMIDKNNTSSFMYRNNIKDVYHELFHNWIGNLVTMEFFDNTWLNEGITKFFENYVCLSPERYGYFCDIIRIGYSYTLSWRTHSLKNIYLKSEEHIRNNFDCITYEKGGYIMNMLLSYFGKEKIYKWLNLYCNKFKFSCINENDFFDTLGEICNYDIKNFLNEWIYEKSFPILYIDYNENNNEIIIEQKPNFGNKDIIFKIPIFIKTKNMEKVILMKEKSLSLKLSDYNITYEDIKENNNFIIFNSDIKSLCLVNYKDENIKNSIFYFYNNYKEKNNVNINIVSDSDIYQIFLTHRHLTNNRKGLIRDIKKMKNTNNFEILRLIYDIFINDIKKTNKFFLENINKSNELKNDIINKLLYEMIDYKNTNLIDQILMKFDNPTNNEKEDDSGQIEFETFVILFLCLFKRDENLVNKIYEIYKNTNFNIYKINKTYRNVLPIILCEFMCLFPEKEKIIIYKSISQYYQEMFYYFYFLDKQNFEGALNNLNNGFSDEILDYYFDNYENLGNNGFCKDDDIIIDYFFKYIKMLYNKDENNKMTFQEYIYDICAIKNFNINDKKFKKIYSKYLLFIGKYNTSIDKTKLFNYCDENYLHLKELNNEKMIAKIKQALYLS